eukprot:GHVU01012513.1.p2 GENE.GHVU01012513.1~~GHVU01012513.1.p2  ORF type:complete len:212 (+),score=19.13 GHVU01012513.1:1534-2169(+)
MRLHDYGDAAARTTTRLAVVSVSLKTCDDKYGTHWSNESLIRRRETVLRPMQHTGRVTRPSRDEYNAAVPFCAGGVQQQSQPPAAPSGSGTVAGTASSNGTAGLPGKHKRAVHLCRGIRRRVEMCSGRAMIMNQPTHTHTHTHTLTCSAIPEFDSKLPPTRRRKRMARSSDPSKAAKVVAHDAASRPGSPPQCASASEFRSRAVSLPLTHS